jgi:hypothetical protein
MADYMSLPFIVTVVAHLVSTIWWAASMTQRIDHIERWIMSHEHTAERLAALEQRIEGIRDGITRIEDFIRRQQE